MTASTLARRLTTLACATVVPLAGIGAGAADPAAAAAPGRWRVSASGTGTATVACPAGTRVFGLGAEVDGGAAFIRELAPDAGLATATVRASAAVSTTVHAVCRPPVADMVRVAATGMDGT